MHPQEGFQTDFEASETSNISWAELGFLINDNTTQWIKEKLGVNLWYVEQYKMFKMQMVSAPPHGLLRKMYTTNSHLWLSSRSSSILLYPLMQLSALLSCMGNLCLYLFSKFRVTLSEKNKCTCKCSMTNIVTQSIFYWHLAFISGLWHPNSKSWYFISASLGTATKESAFLLLVQVHSNCCRTFQTLGYSSFRLIIC